MQVQLLGQRNPDWAFKKLGGSSLTIGRYGCTTVCLSMLSSWFGKFMRPDAIASNKGWYTSGGLIIWQALRIPGMAFVKRVRFRNDSEILKALNDPNSAVILEVDFGQHWIVALRRTYFKLDFLAADPWTSKTCTALADYKNITGYAIFART